MGWRRYKFVDQLLNDGPGGSARTVLDISGTLPTESRLIRQLASYNRPPNSSICFCRTDGPSLTSPCFVQNCIVDS
ncbi:hypothetical protein QVD99_002621 [Batrachochytrium dendrobatidis]|nr:hypothetical protein O5D80_006847 [Batrachochytrium dendrobatidis]KAK5670851.1 hypothetical protein QVD99_002621 [Batrachochytrium dendrobatidis]